MISARKSTLLSEQKYKAVWEYAADAMIFLDHDGVLDCNETGLRLFGLAERETILGRPLADLAPPTQPHGESSSAYLAGQVAAALAGGQSHFECQLQRGDGALFVADVRLHRIDIGGGHAAHAVLRDITERWTVEQTLRQSVAGAESTLAAERRVRAEQAEFVDMVSHEFRTPLAIIDTTTQMLRITQPDAAPEVHYRLGKIESAVDRLTELIDRYLNNDRHALDDSELTLQACELAPLLGEVIESTRSRETGHAIELRLPAERLVLYCDRSLMRIVIDNLVSNAIKYAPPATPITLTAERRGGEILIAVNDKGPGIAARDHDTVFRKFIRGQNVAGTSGAGLGLYIVKRIVERHGGLVELDSEAGHGTTVVLRFFRKFAGPV